MKAITPFVSILVLLVALSAVTQEETVLRGEYFGQSRPGNKAEKFAPLMLTSRPDHYIRSVTFSPTGDEAYWAVIDTEDNYRRWIVGTRLEAGVWTPPQIAPFSDKAFFDDVPHIAPGGQTLLFLSARPLCEGGEMSKENIWRMTRTGDTWAEPVPLPEAVNEPFDLHQQISMDREGNLYFAGEGPDGYGSLDIYRSRYVAGEYEKPVNLGPEINGPSGDYAPTVSLDGSYLVFTRNDDDGWTLMISFRSPDDSWTPPTDLREQMPEFRASNLSGSSITADGRTLIFFENRNDASTPFWVDTAFINSLDDVAR